MNINTKQSIKIAFISALNPKDIHNWSGTLYYIYHTLKKYYKVDWITENIFKEFYLERHDVFERKNPAFHIEVYSWDLCKIISKRLSKKNYDLIISREYLLTAYLETDIPIIHIGDATFLQYNYQLALPPSPYLALLNELETRLINKCSTLVYSSNWAKKSAINDYNKEPDRVKVVEFGANLKIIPSSEDCLDIYNSDMSICNILTIGVDEKRKGIEKVYHIYLHLKQKKFPCTLTIIGCDPGFIDKSDADITVIPFLSKTKDSNLLHEIYLKTHFFILPTVFDCFGIVFCEASAYGIPSLANNSGGVHQVVKNNKNGFLLKPNASITEYADKITELFNDQESYGQLRKSTRKEYEKRLNWDTWGYKMQKIITSTIDKYSNIIITTYCLHFPEKGNKRIITGGKSGLITKELTYCSDQLLNIKKIATDALDNNEDVVIVFRGDHQFPDNYSKNHFFKNIIECYTSGADLLYGNLKSFEELIPLSQDKFWIRSAGESTCIIIYKSLFEKIRDHAVIPGVSWYEMLSTLSSNKMLLFPFVSESQNDEESKEFKKTERSLKKYGQILKKYQL